MAGLIQKAPSTPEEVAASAPLDIAPDVVAEMTEEEWYRQAYRGDDMPQLTIRAILMGSILGFFLAFTNLYIGLKTGWHLGVAITACILSYALWSTMQSVGIAKTPMSILENNCMQSTASAAGYSTGGTMVSAIAALLMLSATEGNPQGTHLPVFVLTAWTFFLAVLGVTLAIPMKRNLINQERLKFPSGLAAAATLQSLYAKGDEAVRKARALGWAALVGAIFPLLIDLPARRFLGWDTSHGEGLLPGDAKVFDMLPARGTVESEGVVSAAKPSDWTLVWDMNPVMVAAGVLVGFRVSFWMVVGGLILAFGLGPWGQLQGWENGLGEMVFATSAPYKAWREIGLWFGAPMLVASGILSFAFQWKTIVRAFTSFGSSGGGGDAELDALVAKTEVPMSWFATGMLVSGAGVVAIAAGYFEIPWYYGVLAVVLTFGLGLVAARATGETDITPTGAMGKIMQLTYGVLIPQSATANLMTAGITAGAASSTADLLTDLKSGYLLGANPRRQFLAQAFGIFSGTLATVAGFYILVPDATVLMGSEGNAPAFPAPAAQAWLAIAKVFMLGIDNMHPAHRNAIFAGLAIGAVLVILEKALPAWKKWLPSPSGLGFGFILPFQYPLSMLVGALIAMAWKRTDEASAEDFAVPMSAGLIAGVSIIGVIVAALNNFVLA